LLCDGASLSTTTYAALYAVIGYTYGGSGASFSVPDLRGRVPVGKDNMGGSTASRITNTNSGITGTTLGASGGDERLHQHTHTQDSHNHTQNSHNHTQDSHNHTQNAHTHGPRSINSSIYAINAYFTNQTANAMVQGTGSTKNIYYTTVDTDMVGSTTAVNQATTATNQAATATNIATTATNQNTGSGTAQNVQPSLIVNYIIKT
jgi:hypothetical protein